MNNSNWLTGLVKVVDRATRQISATLLRYNADKLESSFAEVQRFAKKKEDEKFQQIVYVKYKVEEIIYPLHVANGGKVPVANDVFSSNEQEIYPTNSFEEDYLEFDFSNGSELLQKFETDKFGFDIELCQGSRLRELQNQGS